MAYDLDRLIYFKKCNTFCLIFSFFYVFLYGTWRELRFNSFERICIKENLEVDCPVVTGSQHHNRVFSALNLLMRNLRLVG